MYVQLQFTPRPNKHGLGFINTGLGFRGLGFKIGLGFRVYKHGLGFRVLGFRV